MAPWSFAMHTTWFGFAYFVVWFLFAVPATVFLLRAYGRSKMSGFMWLLMAVVVWPFMAQCIRLGMPAMAQVVGYSIQAVLMLNLGLAVVGGILLVVAVAILDKELGQRIVAAQPVMPTTVVSPTESL
jgi:hypothetical protein